MRVPDPLSALDVSQELRGNRTIQFLVGLMPSLLLGVICAAFMGRPFGAWMFGALTLSGVGVGSWFARRVPAAPATAAPTRSSDGGVDRTVTTAVSSDFARERNDVVLVLELRTPSEAPAQTGSDFLATVHPFSDAQADSTLRLERRGVAEEATGQPECWTLLAHADEVTARYVQVAVGGGTESRTPRMTALLRRLHLSRRKLRELLHTLATGRSVFSSPLKGVVLCCSLADVRRHLDAIVGTAARELDALGHALGARFPIYIVATDLQQVAGFAEFTAALKSRRGAAALDEAFGVAIDRDDRGKEGLSRRVLEMTSELAAWRPSLLATLDEQARYTAPEHTAVRKALIYEFPRQLAMASTVFADFCWGATAAAQATGRGPVLRGVFFTGLVLPDVDPYAGSLVISAPFHRRAFAWNLLTRHITNSVVEEVDRASH